MTAELWLVKPCKHGHLEAHEGWPSDAKVWGDYIDCEGGSSVRFDPEQVVEGLTVWSDQMLNSQGGHYRDATVADILDALEEE